MMQMSPCSMPWCKCPLGDMQWMRMYPCGYAMNANVLTQIIQKFPLFSKWGFLSTRNLKCFQNSIYYSRKGHLFFFWIKVPRNWWSPLKILKWGVDLKSDDLAQKIYFYNLTEQRSGTFKALFGKMNSLKIKYLKKVHFCCLWIWQFGKCQDPPW